MKTVLPRVMLSALLVVCCAGVLAADATPQVQNGIAYISGGIGSDDKETMLAARHDYNTFMTFAIKDSGEYQADVDVTVSGRDGKAVATFKAVGPLFYTKLAPGTYKIEATARGKTQSRAATLAPGGNTDVKFYWDAK